MSQIKPKSQQKGRLINISLFLNPGIFYFTNGKESTECHSLKNYLNDNYEPKQQFTASKGDVVVINKNGLHRARVIDVFEVSSKDSPILSRTYRCWLIDSGIICEANRVFEITEELAKFQPLLKRGCLNNIVPFTKTFDLFSNEYKASVTDNFEIGAIKQACEHIFQSGNQTIFTTIEVDNEIEIGKIMIMTTSMETYDLAETLLASHLVGEDSTYFKQMIKSSKFSNLDAILHEMQSSSLHFPNNSCRKLPVNSVDTPYDIIDTPSVGRGTTRACLSKKSHYLPSKPGPSEPIPFTDNNSDNFLEDFHQDIDENSIISSKILTKTEELMKVNVTKSEPCNRKGCQSDSIKTSTSTSRNKMLLEKLKQNRLTNDVTSPEISLPSKSLQLSSAELVLKSPSVHSNNLSPSRDEMCQSGGGIDSSSDTIRSGNSSSRNKMILEKLKRNLSPRVAESPELCPSKQASKSPSAHSNSSLTSLKEMHQSEEEINISCDSLNSSDSLARNSNVLQKLKQNLSPKVGAPPEQSFPSKSPELSSTKQVSKSPSIHLNSSLPSHKQMCESKEETETSSDSSLPKKVILKKLKQKLSSKVGAPHQQSFPSKSPEFSSSKQVSESRSIHSNSSLPSRKEVYKSEEETDTSSESSFLPRSSDSSSPKKITLGERKQNLTPIVAASPELSSPSKSPESSTCRQVLNSPSSSPSGSNSSKEHRPAFAGAASPATPRKASKTSSPTLEVCSEGDSNVCDWSLLSKCSQSPSDLKILPAGIDLSALRRKKAAPTPENRRSPKAGLRTSVSPCTNSSMSPREDAMKEYNPRTVCTKISVENESNPQKANLKSTACKCDKCIEWLESNDLLFKEKTKTPAKEPKVIRRPEKLLHTDESLESSSCDFLLSDLDQPRPKAMHDHHTLVHGYLVPRPVTMRCEVYFHSDIHKSMDKMGLMNPRATQAYAWPSAMRGHHTVVVDAVDSGKTTFYIPTVLSFVLEKDRYEELPTREPGPVAVVLCPGTQSVENVFGRTRRYLSAVSCMQQPGVLQSVPPFRNGDFMWKKECDLLITTPRMLIRILKSRILKLKRLCYLVIEDFDLINKTYPKELEIILFACNETLSHRVVDIGIQILVTSKEWSPTLERSLKRLKAPPVICIGDYLQAAVYGKIILKVFSTAKERKLRKLLETLKPVCYIYKTVIVCKDTVEIDSIFEFLTADGLSVFKAYDTDEGHAVRDTELRWNACKAGSYSIMVCTDDILNTSFSIRSAMCLVHFSLPPTWTRFTRRFRCLLDNCTSPIVTTKEMRSELQRSKVFVFIDETNALQFPKLINFMQNLGIPEDKIPLAIIKISKKLELEKEEERQKGEVFLCPFVKQFGVCANSHSCNYRHLLSNTLDAPNEIYCNGLIKYLIVYVKNVTSFYARLISHVDAQGKVTDLSADYVILPVRMSSFFGKQANRRCAVEVSVGEMYAVDQSVDFYQRCVVTKILKMNNLENPLVVSVYLVDHGSEMSVNVSSLLVLPDDLREFKPQVFEFWLADVGPPDLDTHWSSQSKETLLKLLEKAEYNKGTSYCASEILLQLGQMFWVKDVGVLQHLDEFNVHAFKLSFRKTLKSNHLLDERPEHMKALYELCERGGIELPDFSAVPKPPKPPPPKQVTPSWAFFDEGEKHASIYFCSAFFDCLLVRLCKYDVLLKNLMNDIQSEVELILRHRKDEGSKEEKLEIQVGKCYLCKEPETALYNRALVLEVDGDTCEVLTVDYGDLMYVKLDDLLFLSNELITKLPFQIIECRLHGVSIKDFAWSEQSQGLLYDKFMFFPGTEFLGNWYVKPVKVEPSRYTRGKRYSVAAMDIRDGEEVLINSHILREGGEVAVVDEPLDTEEFFGPLRKLMEEMQAVGEDEDLEELPPADLEAVAKPQEGGKEEEEEENSESSNDEHTWDVVCHDMDKFKNELWQLMAAKHGTPSEFAPDRSALRAVSSNVEEIQENAPMRPVSTVDYISPPLVWYQNDELLKMTIQLPEPMEYDVKLARNKIFDFRTTIRGKLYKISLNLYAKLENTFQHTCSGCSVYLTLKKVEAAEWPRLTADTRRLKNVRYNFDQGKKEAPSRILDMKGLLDDDWTCETDLFLNEENADYDDSDYEVFDD